SGHGVAVRRHGAQPDRSGHRDHGHHHERVPGDQPERLAADELVQRAHRAGGALAMDNLVFKPDLPAPALSVGPLGWLRANLFSNWRNTLLTLLGLYLVWQVVPPLIDWAFIEADWRGET